MQHIPRFFTENILKPQQNLTIDNDNHHHIRNVLRMKEGDKSLFFNGKDGEFTATLDKCDRHVSHFTLHDQTRPQEESAETWLIIGMLKPDIMGFITEKATELQIAALLPIITTYATHDHCRPGRPDKLRARAIKAAQQCERLSVPQIFEPIRLDHLPSVFPEDRHIYAAVERGTHPHLWNKLKQQRPAKTALLIGPAGGFSEAEAEYLQNLPNAESVSLGKSLLRAETAAFMGLSLLYAAQY